MSTAVYVYSVPVERLRTVAGSKDRKLLAATRKPRFFSFFHTIDAIATDKEDGGERPPKCAEALRQIISGEPYDDGFASIYGYAYEAICMALGAEIERSWTGIAGSFEWFKEIDKALALLGIRLKVTDLVCRGPLVAIPRPDDFPTSGHWTAEEVAKAAGVFDSLDLMELDAKTSRRIKRVSEAIEDIRSWIKVAAGRPGNWLIGVHS